MTADEVTDPTVTSERARASREYLAAFFEDEEGWDGDQAPRLRDWFDGLGKFVGQIPLADSRLIAAFQYLSPFFDDDPRLDGYAMYPKGAAVGYLEDNWGGDFDSFLTGFVAALRTDFESSRPVENGAEPGSMPRHGVPAVGPFSTSR